MPEGLVKINEYTFMGGKAVATVTLPEGLKEIGDYAFSDWTTVRESSFHRRLNISATAPCAIGTASRS